MKIIAFFNNKGGVGNTTLVYHLAWMLYELRYSVVAADLDPQSHLTSMFLDESRLEELWPDGRHPQTIQGVIEPIQHGTGGIASPHLETIAGGQMPGSGRLDLLAGDPGLSGFEDQLSAAWPECRNGNQPAFRTMTSFRRALLTAAAETEAELALIDVGANLGAINRAALIAADHVVIPLAPDLFSLQGLRNLGPRLRQWRSIWKEVREKNPDPGLALSSGEMRPAGYVVLQRGVRVHSRLRWLNRIPKEYRESVLGETAVAGLQVANDPCCLAALRHYHSLMPMASEARKPMFHLKPSDGAIGSHAVAVRDCYQEFRTLALSLLRATGVDRAARVTGE